MVCVRRLGGDGKRPRGRGRRARKMCLPVHRAKWVREEGVAAEGIVGVQRGGGGAVMNAVTQERTRGWRWAYRERVMMRVPRNKGIRGKGCGRKVGNAVG